MNGMFQKYTKKLGENAGMGSINKTQKVVVKVTFIFGIILFILMFVFQWLLNQAD